jgi:hypothetical protein
MALTLRAPMVAVADIVRRMNELEDEPTPGRKRVTWRYRNVVALLEAGGVHIIGEPGCKRYVGLADLRFTFPTFYDSMMLADELDEVEHDESCAA